MRSELLYPLSNFLKVEHSSVKETTILQRKVTFRMYPSAAQEVALGATATAHCKIYNTLLEVSRLRYKAGLPAYTRTTVCEAVKSVRNTHAWIETVTTAQSAQVTGQRLVKAFDNFFARVAKGCVPSDGPRVTPG
jgi:putative transposase